MKGETERERLLLVYQVNDEVQQGHFPVNKELALEVAALLAQVRCRLSSECKFHSLSPKHDCGEPDVLCSIWRSPNKLFLPLPQVEHGDLEKAAAFSAAGSPQPKSQLVLLQVLDRFYPKRYRHDCSSEQLR